jgi:hypothetical protein
MATRACSRRRQIGAPGASSSSPTTPGHSPKQSCIVFVLCIYAAKQLAVLCFSVVKEEYQHRSMVELTCVSFVWCCAYKRVLARMNMHGTAFFPPNFPAEKCHVVHYTSAYFTATSAELSCEFYIILFSFPA